MFEGACSVGWQFVVPLYLDPRGETSPVALFTFHFSIPQSLAPVRGLKILSAEFPGSLVVRIPDYPWLGN